MCDHDLPPSNQSRHLVITHVVLPTVLFALLILLIESQRWDIWVGDFFFDCPKKRWYGQGLWWANALIHTGGRNLILGIFLVGLGIFGLSWFQSRWHRWRHMAAYACLAIALSTGLTAAIKNVSNKDCPKNLARYGGNRPYYSLWETKPELEYRGKCFPGGHSSGAFSLFFVYFIWQRRYPRLAMGSIVGVCLLGLVYGLGQWTRGAHFPSHDLWSAWLAWQVALALHVFYYQKFQNDPEHLE